MLQEQHINQEKAEKLTLVLQCLSAHCNADSEYEVFRKIAEKTAAGKQLVGENLEGCTNFSYRIFPQDNRDISVFVKIGFEHARWNPEKSFYDLHRIQTEYDMLAKFADLIGSRAPVVTPYLCLDIAPGIKMLVSQ